MVGDRIERDIIELKGFVLSLELHLELALDVISPLVSTISLATESKWASRAVQVDCSNVCLDECWEKVGLGLVLSVDFRDQEGEGGRSEKESSRQQHDCCIAEYEVGL